MKIAVKVITSFSTQELNVDITNYRYCKKLVKTQRLRVITNIILYPLIFYL